MPHEDSLDTGPTYKMPGRNEGQADSSDKLEVSIVIPCLNEERTLGNVIRTAFSALGKFNYNGEVIISDNGSTDASVQIAESLGARVAHAKLRGYGAALSCGIESARGRYVVIGDADESYDFMQIDRFIEPLRTGVDFVMGSRLNGDIEPGAMPVLHRYLGTPVLTFLINFFFGTKFSDCNCGIRGFTKSAFRKMDLHTLGMEFASEMILKASLEKLRAVEVPVSLRVDKRDRRPHLRPWRDGWHHLRFILAYAADKILIGPGLFFLTIGLVGFALLWQKQIWLGSFSMDYHFLFPSSLCIMLGVQMILFSLLTKTYTGLAQYSKHLSPLRKAFTFEGGMILGTILVLIGLSVNLFICWEWSLSEGQGLFAVRPAIIALTVMAVGFQFLFNGFFMSALQIPQRRVISTQDDEAS
jgi:glycosyltransferase involved in cell wall biosynthesis